MSLPPYRLRAELYGHESDVRGVAADANSTRVATGSRDSSALVWDLADGAGAPTATLRGHDHFVNAVAFLPSGEIVSASSDHTIRLWKADPSGGAECVAVLKGHDNNVCHVAVAAGSSGSTKILSSSWDTTARVWDVKAKECVTVLRGHEAAVWAGLPLPDGRFVTVGADKTIRLWSAAGVQHSVLPSVHTDVVRSIAAGPGGGFITVANDSAAVLWMPNAASAFDPCSQLQSLHDGSFAYCVDGMALPAGSGADRWLFVSGGEDNALRVVIADSSSGEFDCAQTIVLPGVVWSVALAPNGDIIAGCSDNVARVFTRDRALVAEESVLTSFEKAVSERQLSTKVIGGVDVAKLPAVEEALSVPGKKDGENKMVRTGPGTAEVHMWSASDAKWTKVGDIVDGPGGGASMGGGEVDGKKYDFVFEVELGDGGKKKTLGYNKGENTYLAAQRFIDDNDLNQDFLDQIATFIDQQLPPDVAASAGGAVSDPLTGGSRYVPRGSATQGSAGTGGDPLTGGSRYVPGNGSGFPAQARTLPPPRKYLPHPTGPVTYLTSDQMDKIQAKLAEFNDQLTTQNSPLALTEEEASVFGSSLLPKLKSKSSGSSLVFDDNECALAEKMVEWPTALVFPVLDMARLVVARPSGGVYFFGKKNGKILDSILAHMGSAEATPAVLIMGCRFLCNMFGNRVVASAAQERSSEIITKAAVAAKSTNRRARETYGSLLVNYAVSLHSSKASADERSLPMKTAIDLLSSGEKDEEVVFRLLVSVGTLMCGGKDMSAKGLELGGATVAAAAAPLSARIQQVAHEIATLIAT